MKWICTIFFFLISTTLYAEEVILANGEWPPFLSKDLPHYGYASHIVSEAFDEVGISIKYKFLPWARAERYVNTGQVDGSIIWSKRTDREKFAYFSNPVIVQNDVLFYLKDHPIVWNTIEDLHGLKVGLALGSTLGILKEPIEAGKIELHRTVNIKLGFMMLLAGRIDAHPLIDSVGYHLLRTKFTPEERAKITHSHNPLETITYRLMLSKAKKSSTDFLRRFNQGLNRLKNNGKYYKMEKDFYAGKYD